MTTSQIINQTLWNELRESINKAYAAPAERGSQDEHERACLRDYAENISWSDALSALAGRETANERQHRSNRPSVPGFSCSTAAKLILMTNVAQGAKAEAMPSATAFLVLRQTAVEAQVIGWLIRKHLDAKWIEAVENLDYAKLMAA
jgi:hypothetical protein